MPTIANLFVFDVPHINRIEGTPCKVAPCPFCRGLHRLPSDTKSTVAAPCPPHETATFEKRPRPDYWSLIHGGPAVRPLVLLLETGDDMTANLELLAMLQPIEVWREIQTVPDDPTTKPDPFPGSLDAGGGNG
jgi:hypothetical protein